MNKREDNKQLSYILLLNALLVCECSKFFFIALMYDLIRTFYLAKVCRCVLFQTFYTGGVTCAGMLCQTSHPKLWLAVRKSYNNCIQYVTNPTSFDFHAMRISPLFQYTQPCNFEYCLSLNIKLDFFCSTFSILFFL